MLGRADGLALGAPLVGPTVGCVALEGAAVGNVGLAEGASDGLALGPAVGASVLSQHG